MFAAPDENGKGLFISEHFSDTASDLEAMTAKAMQLFNFDKAYLRSMPVNDRRLYRRGMLKIVSRDLLLNRLKEGNISLERPLPDSDEELSKIIFRDIYPYMNLMLD